MHGTIKLNNYVNRRDFSDAEVLAALYNAARKAKGARSDDYRFDTRDSLTAFNVDTAQRFIDHAKYLSEFMQKNLKQIDNLEIRNHYSRNPSYFNFLLGRNLNIDLSQLDLYVADYDRENGAGAARRAIETLYARRNQSTTMAMSCTSFAQDVINGLPVPLVTDISPSIDDTTDVSTSIDGIESRL